MREDEGARGRWAYMTKAQQDAPGSNWWTRLKTRGSLNPSKGRINHPHHQLSRPELEEALQHENTPHFSPCEALLDPASQGTSCPSTAELLAHGSALSTVCFQPIVGPFPSDAPAGLAPLPKQGSITHCQTRSPGLFLPRQGGSRSSSSRRQQAGRFGASRRAGWE